MGNFFSDLNRGNRPSHAYEMQNIALLLNKLDNTIAIAKVTKVNKEKMTVTVSAKAGELTDIEAFVLAHGSDDFKQWIPPNIGDSVLLLSVNGELNRSYCLPIRLPPTFNSNIPDGAITRAGDVTIQYNKGDNTYEIKHKSKSIILDENKIQINNGSKITLNNNNLNVSGGNGDITLNNSSVSASIGSSSINLTPTSCTITVPGGVMAIVGGSFTFNGRAVLLAP
jgi:phage baseplate assembly protein gpV